MKGTCHGTSDDSSAQCSRAENCSVPPALFHLGLTGALASYCTPSASTVQTRMVLVSY